MITTQTKVSDLKAGDIVSAHGGVFRVTEDARDSRSHFQECGPSGTAYAPAVCIEGQCGGYFYPGSSWTFQGKYYVTFRRVIAR